MTVATNSLDLSTRATEETVTPIVRQTRYGDTMFVSNPIKAARAMVTWAMEQGYSLCEIENMGYGCIKVNIPGLTNITLAPEAKKIELL
jgi:hypothetical protein